MKSLANLLSVAMVFAMALTWVAQADAHDILRDSMKERYDLKSATCYACHPGSNKAINNAFGLKFKEGFKGKDFTKRIKELKEIKEEFKKDAAKVADVKAKLDKIDEEMVAEFEKLVPEIESSQVDMTFAELIKGGMMYGAKLQKEAIAELGKAQGVEPEEK